LVKEQLHEFRDSQEAQAEAREKKLEEKLAKMEQSFTQSQLVPQDLRDDRSRSSITGSSRFERRIRSRSPLRAPASGGDSPQNFGSDDEDQFMEDSEGFSPTEKEPRPA